MPRRIYPPEKPKLKPAKTRQVALALLQQQRARNRRAGNPCRGTPASQSVTAADLIVEDGTRGPARELVLHPRVTPNDCWTKSLYPGGWSTATDDIKATALAMASRVIDTNMIWNGWLTTQDQALQWPRIQVPNIGIFDLTLGTGITQFGQYWANNVIPPRLMDAVSEMAKILIEGDRTIDDPSKGLKALKLGQGAIDIEFDKLDRKRPLTDEVARMLAIFGRQRGKRSSVSVVRTQ